ncbi:type IX secretion system periplasmic lipoprotein PorW/SprE [Mucilaginibacter agri]|uniref:Tetratricopeptide repeat protein n=1 Tax=Mucilaginibacter agri TaxID=2695265 RepID=A0A965ZK77_9SPHI|nr:tetratricopeptide repeat protein [Mucilaginibacter agri]NCD71563.1 tetratricopeptide repeat protein [Mucilaginibacter agri]
MKYYWAINTYIKHLLRFLLLIGLLAGCSLEKKSAVNRGLQNLTAHYNILFNANDLLRQKQEIYAASYIDNYSQILRVYQDTIAHSGVDKDLDAVIGKANNIINLKEQSHYIGDAYLLLTKANYLYGSYFVADEFGSYVVRNYSDRPLLSAEARNWRVRTLLNLHQLPLAKAVSDTGLSVLFYAKKKVDAANTYAARLQYDIDAGDYKEGEEMAKNAIKAVSDSKLKRRLIFILAQLQEQNHKSADAYASYSKIVKSNAVFEMAFNAELNRIRIEDTQNNVHITRQERLRRLLRNENNKEFIDQIYYQIAELYAADGKIEDAIKNYRLSINHSTKNQNQKGLDYLRLADISFTKKGDYTAAKNLYDSTLLNLSPTYPGYRTIQLKANNLQILGEQLRIIAREDTLQQLAQLNEKDRAARLDELAKIHVTEVKAAAAAATTSAFTDANAPTSSVATATTPGANTFYFYNVNSLSQGFNDFKRRWGNRKLEDNWRRSARANSDITNNTQNITNQVDPSVLPKKDQKSNDDIIAATYKQMIVQDLPLTPQNIAASNARVYTAYFNIANFYRDVLQDHKEAITTYETLLKRFPDGTEKPAIYYNLYRLYSDIDQAKSDYYKDLLLKNYAETPFAKVILDPDYGRKMNDKDAEFNALYNQVYDLYAHKQYTDVIDRTNQLLQQFPGNKLAAQLAYLKAMAAGHQEKLLPFRMDLYNILNDYPNDPLIVPLINEHLTYIDANQAELASRPVVLVDNDLYDSPFAQSLVITKTPVVVQAPPAAAKQPAANQPAKVTAVTKPANMIFSMRDSSRYYFVINVNAATTNLSSSRFGIGQFNRANYPPEAGIKHQLKYAGTDNQLIFVGVFPSLASAKDYARAIIPLMPQIMKVPADKYSFFIATQENLDKLEDKKMLDSYIDFYQKNY